VWQLPHFHILFSHFCLIVLDRNYIFMLMTSEAILRKVMPKATEEDIRKYLPVFNKYKDLYKVNTPMREAAFWSQVAVESNQLRNTEENLYYRTPEQIQRTWPSRFRSVAAAMPYVRNPERLGNKVYGGRLGNPADKGYAHRGAGLIQLTGYSNQLEYSKATYGDDRIIHNPELLHYPEDAMRSALWFWHSRDVNKIADTGDVAMVTKRVNGGSIGLAERKLHYSKAIQAFNV
jgi:putative chitinase